jgi:hypothetical protein
MDKQTLNELVKIILINDLELKGKETEEKIKNATNGDKKAEEEIIKKKEMILNHYRAILSR